MADDPGSDDDDNDSNGHGGEPAQQPGAIHGSFRLDHRTARLPKSVGNGEFANALMVAAGPLEFILDFVQRLGEPARVVTRVVMPPLVAGQFVQALEHNVGTYEQQFGAIPALPQPRAQQSQIAQSDTGAGQAGMPANDPGMAAYGSGGMAGAGIEPQPGPPQSPPSQRPIEDIYDDLKLDEEMLSGRYANAVIVRHSPAEFAFEFVARFMPHSVVSSRVIVSAPNVPSLLASLKQALGDHARRQQPPGRGELPPPSEN